MVGELDGARRVGSRTPADAMVRPFRGHRSGEAGAVIGRNPDQDHGAPGRTTWTEFRPRRVRPLLRRRRRTRGHCDAAMAAGHSAPSGEDSSVGARTELAAASAGAAKSGPSRETADAPAARASAPAAARSAPSRGRRRSSPRVARQVPAASMARPAARRGALGVGHRPANGYRQRSGHATNSRSAPSVLPWPANARWRQRFDGAPRQNSQCSHGIAGSTATSRRPRGRSPRCPRTHARDDGDSTTNVPDAAIEEPVTVRPAKPTAVTRTRDSPARVGNGLLVSESRARGVARPAPVGPRAPVRRPPASPAAPARSTRRARACDRNGGRAARARSPPRRPRSESVRRAIAATTSRARAVSTAAAGDGPRRTGRGTRPGPPANSSAVRPRRPKRLDDDAARLPLVLARRSPAGVSGRVTGTGPGSGRHGSCPRHGIARPACAHAVAYGRVGVDDAADARRARGRAAGGWACRLTGAASPRPRARRRATPPPCRPRSARHRARRSA